MPDSRTARLFTQALGWLTSSEARWDTAQRNAALQLNGHPKAQDFEPTGRSGSDPTSINGTKPDQAAADGREMRRCLERIWTECERLVYLTDKYRDGVRPEKPDDGGLDRSDWCVLHLELDEYEPRYRLDLCRPCSERRYQTGDYPTVEDLRYHASHGRWPRTRINPLDPPKPKTNRQGRQYVATTEALTAGIDRIEEAG